MMLDLLCTFPGVQPIMLMSVILLAYFPALEQEKNINTLIIQHDMLLRVPSTRKCQPRAAVAAVITTF
jgi:hypothetical protein